MEVHAHTHTARKKWTHYLWEFLMLFFAVTLGFFVENLREQKIEHHRAKGYAGMLKLDMINDTLSLNHLINVLTTESVNRDFIIALFNNEMNDLTIAELRKKDTLSFLMDDFLPNNATLEQMKSSGELRFFKNIELTGMLAYYDWSIKHYLQMKQNIEGVYGGMSGEHLLQYDIKIGEFLKKSENMDSSISALKAGYKFDSWAEIKKITGVRVFFKNFLKENIYPDLKKQAMSIITYLNKEYHLK